MYAILWEKKQKKNKKKNSGRVDTPLKSISYSILSSTRGYQISSGWSRVESK